MILGDSWLIGSSPDNFKKFKVVWAEPRIKLIRHGMICGSSVAESGETGARPGWFVALSGKSALSRGSLVAHSGHWG